MTKLNPCDRIFLALLILGALNVGFMGLFRIDPISFVFGSMTVASRIVHTLVGLSAVYAILLFSRLAAR